MLDFIGDVHCALSQTVITPEPGVLAAHAE